MFVNCKMARDKLSYNRVSDLKRSKEKRPYLTSITRNSNSTDKPEVDVALILIYSLLYISAPFYGYLKLLKLH